MTRTTFFMLACLACAAGTWADSLYPIAGGGNSIYTEKRARRVGDVVTVIIQEQTRASQGVTNNNQKNANVGFGAGVGFFSGYNNIPTQSQVGVGAQSYNQGQGSASRASQVTGQITAKIISVLPNGNYQISGDSYVEVNEDKQTIELTGEIRPDDISSENTIPSTRIANVKVKFTGSGPASESAHPGLLTRVLSWLGLF
ncbi:MAG TPA: flagellar basal body L-ring protein FlgH [bacterium]|nr:flagellar basal body L-ring protein FlgH [bacterium]